MFSLPTEDEDFFQPQNASSNLALLFGLNSPAENSDLIYVAPKQPTPTTNNTPKQKPEKPKPANTVLFAKVVQVYKTINEFRKIVGKYGLALVGDSVQAKELLLYKDKQNILARAIFTENFSMHCENDYVTFEDSNKKTWHIKFEEATFLTEFLDELKKCNIEIIEEINESLSVSVTTTDSSITSKSSEETSVSQTRAEILSRMAKMGQPILPAISKSFEDSSSELSSNTKDLKPFEYLKQRNLSSSSESMKSNDINPVGSQPYVVAPTNSTQLSSYIAVAPNPNIVNTVITASEFALFASENRIHNSEMRMNLTTISSKLDNILHDISRIKEPTNTDRLENEFLKSKIMDLEKNLSETTKKLTDNRISTDNRCLELEELIQQKNIDLDIEKMKIFELEHRLDEFKKSFWEMEDLRAAKNELEQTIKNLCSQMADSERKLNESHSDYTKLQELYKNLLSDNTEMKNKLNVLELSKKTESPSIENLDQEVKSFSDITKLLMNCMFQDIVAEIQDGKETSLNNELKIILSRNIKQTTFNVIEKFKTVLGPQENSNGLIGDMTDKN